MIKLALSAAALALALPATATVTIQTRTVQLGTLDVAAIAQNVAFDNFSSFGLTDHSLRRVEIKLDAAINGSVSAFNDATGGTPASRLRSITAAYTLNAAATRSGLGVSGTNTQSETRPFVSGGALVTLDTIDPTFSVANAVSSGFTSYLAGPVQFAFTSNAVFARVNAVNVTYSSPSISTGTAVLTLIYTSVIPEPSSWVLLIVGFGVVGVFGRRTARALAA